jgi:hypothetical protein
MKYAFRFRTAPNGPWVYFRLEAVDDDDPVTLQDATQYVLERLRGLDYFRPGRPGSLPWVLVQAVRLSEATYEKMPLWLFAGAYGLRNARSEPSSAWLRN